MSRILTMAVVTFIAGTCLAHIKSKSIVEVQIQKGSAWKPELGPKKQPHLTDHVAHLKNLYKKNHVEFYGSEDGHHKALLLLRSDDQNQAMQWINDSPDVKHNILKASVRTLSVLMQGKHDHKH